MIRLAIRILPVVLLVAACAEQPVAAPARPHRDVVVGSLSTDSTNFGLVRPCPSECAGG